MNYILDKNLEHLILNAKEENDKNTIKHKKTQEKTIKDNKISVL
jgi:hypothetical protein